MHRQVAQRINSLFVAERPSSDTPTPRGTWGNLGETRGGCGKSGVPEHKSGCIAETHKDRGKVTMEDLWELTNAPSTLLLPTPNAWIGDPTKNSSRKLLENECTYSNSLYGIYIGLGFWGIWECGQSQGLPEIFWLLPIISGMGKASDFKCGRYIQRVHPNKSTFKNLEKRERGHIQRLPSFGVPHVIPLHRNG